MIVLWVSQIINCSYPFYIIQFCLRWKFYMSKLEKVFYICGSPPPLQILDIGLADWLSHNKYRVKSNKTYTIQDMCKIFFFLLRNRFLDLAPPPHPLQTRYTFNPSNILIFGKIEISYYKTIHNPCLVSVPNPPHPCAQNSTTLFFLFLFYFTHPNMLDAMGSLTINVS